MTSHHFGTRPLDSDPIPGIGRWFQSQLKASGLGFAWAVEQVPLERRLIQPPIALGEWSVARHAFHLLFYEQNIALPTMLHWLGGPKPSLFGLDEDGAWGQRPKLEDIVALFLEVRSEQIDLLPRFTAEQWEEMRKTIWGPVSLRWVLTKTYQHTNEHVHGVLSIALYWDWSTA